MVYDLYSLMTVFTSGRLTCMVNKRPQGFTYTPESLHRYQAGGRSSEQWAYSHLPLLSALTSTIVCEAFRGSWASIFYIGNSR